MGRKAASPNANWTTNELKAFIRENTKKLNEHYRQIELTGATLKEDFPVQYQQRERLIAVSGVGERAGKVGLGLTYKTKDELIIQARAINQAQKLDFADIAKTEKYRQAYETFTRNHPDATNMSYDDYIEMSEALGALDEHISSQFGYDASDHSFMNLYAEAAQQEDTTAVDLIRATKDVIKQSKGQGWSTEDMIDRLREHLIK